MFLFKLSGWHGVVVSTDAPQQQGPGFLVFGWVLSGSAHTSTCSEMLNCSYFCLPMVMDWLPVCSNDCWDRFQYEVVQMIESGDQL